MFDYLATLARHGRIDPLEFYVSDAHRAVYVENAKVACTAIKAALFPTDYEAASADPSGQDAFHEAVRHRARFRLPVAARDYFVFTFVRHPVSRLHSCFRDKVRGEAASPEASILHRRFHRGIFATWGGVDIRRSDMPFDQFARAVGQIPDRISDRHFAAQSRMVEAVTAAPRHFVGRIERMEEDWAAVRSETGLPALPVANRSNRPGSGDLCDRATREVIARRYAKDFELLGYER